MIAVGNQTGERSLGLCSSVNEKSVNRKVAIPRPKRICVEWSDDVGIREIRWFSFFITTFSGDILSGHTEINPNYASSLALFIGATTLIDNNRRIVRFVIFH